MVLCVLGAMEFLLVQRKIKHIVHIGRVPLLLSVIRFLLIVLWVLGKVEFLLVQRILNT